MFEIYYKLLCGCGANSTLTEGKKEENEDCDISAICNLCNEPIIKQNKIERLVDDDGKLLQKDKVIILNVG